MSKIGWLFALAVTGGAVAVIYKNRENLQEQLDKLKKR